jgi:NADPH2:quinone reductase
MKAMLVHELGGLDKLTLSDVPSPEPGPGQVRIAVHAAGCNFADTLMISGVYQNKPERPFIPGLEVAGTVIDRGPGVTGFAAGERVIAWLNSGAYAREAVAEAADVFAIPAGMDFVTAAAFPIAYATALVALAHRRVDLRAGEVLLVHGAAGGVGLAAVEVGKAMGAIVVGTVGSDEKRDIVTARGADHVINYSTESIRDRVKALVGGADVVYDPVGGDAFMQSLRCINTDGRLAIIGFASGTIPQIPANYLLVKNIAAIGIAVGSYRRIDPEFFATCFERLIAWHEAGALHPHVSHTFPLAETAAALGMLIARKATGKVVVTMR